MENNKKNNSTPPNTPDNTPPPTPPVSPIPGPSRVIRTPSKLISKKAILNMWEIHDKVKDLKKRLKRRGLDISSSEESESESVAEEDAVPAGKRFKKDEEMEVDRPIEVAPPQEVPVAEGAGCLLQALEDSELAFQNPGDLLYWCHGSVMRHGCFDFRIVQLDDQTEFVVYVRMNLGSGIHYMVVSN